MSEQLSKKYYDEFSHGYEKHRHDGYHALLDDLEVGVAAPYCTGRILEAGCGTGLILSRLARGAQEAYGVDLSAGMLSHARKRGLKVVQGSLTAIPFRDNYFDAVVSFKVLAHIPDIRGAVAEMARVTRPGGHLVLEFYNRQSIRYWIKRLKTPTNTSHTFTDEDVFTRFDTLEQVSGYLPPHVKLVDHRGVRVFTPASQVYKIPVAKTIMAAAERFAVNAPVLRDFGGFLIVILQKS